MSTVVKPMNRVLIAEDDNVDRMLLEAYLKNTDFEVISTKNGNEAWDVINESKKPPQIVIIDWLMPEMDGIALCKKIREMKSANYIYVILVTAKSMSEDMVQGLEAGADDYLTKPYEKAVLLARINVGTRIVSLEREKNERLKKIRFTNHKLRQDMKAAVQVQLSLLPQKEFSLAGYSFEWFFKPSDLLGGDMLHIYKISDTKVACYVLDVSGHGTQAALLSVTIRNQLTTNSVDSSMVSVPGGLISFESRDTSPLDIVTGLANHYNDLLERTGHFFTIIYGILDTQSGEFNYISAGHHNPILISGSDYTVSEESSGAPIGMFKSQKYIQQKVILTPGDRLYLYTDGIIEETNIKGEQFGNKRLINELMKLNGKRGSLPLVIDGMSDWVKHCGFKDDIALIEIFHRNL